ncbi:M48 family metalloprotease [Microlunatus soli]|uniref:Peptidase M48 domain-containing protein n=1 Tax=Microlunatus soli TaxID=630515 RepID=A0A1H1TZH7_9ACTN|nr:M48 family metalloprotease [Microlunatus soli]SDS65705.1 hypothetical protein SAMN04489812_2583 [Microlunatus soli]
MPATAAKLTRQAKRVIATFGSGEAGTRGQVAVLRQVIKQSPHLKAQLNDAVASGRLTGFGALAPSANAGGEYWPSSGLIKLPSAIVTLSTKEELAFILGHEMQHALNAPTVASAVRDLYFDAHAAAQSSHDYTNAVAHVVQAHREDEASATLAGWNAMLDCHRSLEPWEAVHEIVRTNEFRARDFVERKFDSTWGVRPNLHLNSDLTVDLSPQNIEGMGKNFFDKPASQTFLGHHGDSDYTNYYTAVAVGQAASIHAAVNPGVSGLPGPPMLIDLKQLRASRKSMERNGISLGDADVVPPVPYLDVSTAPPSPGFFHHTRNTHQHVPVADAQDHDHPRSPPSISPVRLAQSSFAHRRRQTAGSTVKQKEAATSRLGSPRGPTTTADRAQQRGGTVPQFSRGSE